ALRQLAGAAQGACLGADLGIDARDTERLHLARQGLGNGLRMSADARSMARAGELQSRVFDLGRLLRRSGLGCPSDPAVCSDSEGARKRHMTRRRLAWIALVSLGVLAAFGALWGMFGPDRITLTTGQIQERVNRNLPREFKNVTVEQATVTVADGRVALRVEARAAAVGQRARAAVSARGVPRFSAERGEIFFDADEVKVTDFAVTGGNVAGRIDRLGALRERLETAAGNAIAAG